MTEVKKASCAVGDDVVILPDDVQPGDIVECHGVKQRVTFEFGAYALEKVKLAMKSKDPGGGGTLLGAAGGFGSVLSATAGLGCCAGALAPAVAAVSATTLGVFDQTRVQLPFLYVALALSLIGLAVSYRRHRRPWALLLAGMAATVLLIPFHVALDVTLFQQMFSAGVVGLILASGCDFLFIWRVRRRACGKRAPAATGSEA